MRNILRQYEYIVNGLGADTREQARELQRDFRRANPTVDKALSKIKQRLTTTTEKIIR